MNKRNMFPLLILLCITAALILTVGVTQARFRENWTETLPFQPAGEENLVLHQDSNWAEDQNTHVLTFSLENTHTEVSHGKLYVLASQGVEKPDKLSITLTFQGHHYTAQAQPIASGSVLHKSFGDGWAYRFLDDEGQEILWTLQPTSQLTFLLTVEDSEEINYHSLIRLVAKKTENS